LPRLVQVTSTVPVIVTKSVALPKPATVPEAVAVTDPPLLLTVQVGVPTKWGLCASAGAAVNSMHTIATDVSARKIRRILFSFRAKDIEVRFDLRGFQEHTPLAVFRSSTRAASSSNVVRVLSSCGDYNVT
jgi:hypothetical protein